MDEAATRVLHVDPADAGTRLDSFLAERLGVSRGQVRRILEAGRVSVAGRVARSADKRLQLIVGDVICVDRLQEIDVIEPDASVPLRIAAEGDGWFVADKPAEVAVHPLRPGERGTLLNAVAVRFPQIQGVGEGGLRSGVVHRLDVTTSGAIVVATDDAAWRRWRHAFESRTVDKRYVAIVGGGLRGQGDEVMDLLVARHRPALVRVASGEQPQAGVRRCTLSWRSIAASRTASFIEVTLGTGFLHQIRVMLAHLGHPLVGDTLYGGPATLGGVHAERPMLHARSIRDGDDGGTCEPPEDFTRCLRGLGLV